jgi:hypothetical protein
MTRFDTGCRAWFCRQTALFVQPAGVAPLQGSRFADGRLTGKHHCPDQVRREYSYSAVDHHFGSGKLTLCACVRNDSIDFMGYLQ